MSRCLRTMRGTESIHYINVTQSGHRFGQLIVVLFFALVESHVFTQHDITRYDIHAVKPVLL